MIRGAIAKKISLCLLRLVNRYASKCRAVCGDRFSIRDGHWAQGIFSGVPPYHAPSNGASNAGVLFWQHHNRLHSRRSWNDGTDKYGKVFRRPFRQCVARSGIFTHLPVGCSLARTSEVGALSAGTQRSSAAGPWHPAFRDRIGRLRRIAGTNARDHVVTAI
jgi:hypothetical protein